MTLRDVFTGMGARRRTVAVYSADPLPELDAYFADWNVELRFDRLPAGTDEAFVTVRAGGEFLGSVDLRTLTPLLEPSGDRAWDDESSPPTDAFLELLDGTTFRTDDRDHLLAVSREFEDRAWRVGTGDLHAGFQRPAAFRAQRDAYTHLADRGLDVHLYADGAWDAPDVEGASVHTTTDGELGRYWFVAFDDGDRCDDTTQACALLAEEHRPGSYAGYWTYDPEWVRDLTDYLTETYGE